jgi:hypothetical protein
LLSFVAAGTIAVAGAGVATAPGLAAAPGVAAEPPVVSAPHGAAGPRVASEPSISTEPFPGIVENRGQLPPDVRFYAPLDGGIAYFTGDAIVIDIRSPEAPADPTRSRHADRGARRLRGHVVRLGFDGEPGGRRIEARVPCDARLHYFLGSSPDRWRVDVPVFGEIVYRDAWPGVDLVIAPDRSGLAWRSVGQAGADPGRVRFRIEGAGGEIELDATTREIATSVGSLFLTREGGQGRIALGDRAPTSGPSKSARLDDPTALRWSTFLGGGSDEIGWSLALDPDDNPVVTGLTLSVAFPTTLGAYDTSYNQFGDVFVCKLSADGSTLLWGTFLGGTGTGFDYGYAVTLDSGARPVVTGYTASSDFPTTVGAYDRTHGGGVDVFVSKLSADGSSLVFSTFMGGGAHDIGYSVALDSEETVVASGRTLSIDFPATPGSYDPTPNGEEDGFVAKLSGDGGTLLWSTFVGGSAYDGAEAVAIDAANRPVVAGYTASSDFPATAGAHDPDWNGGLYDAVAFVLDADGSDLIWGTFLGGGDTEFGNGLALVDRSDPVIVGETGSDDFPVTTGAYDESFNGSDDAFATKLSGATGTLVWSTFLGGTTPFYETAFGVAVDEEDRPVVAGTTPAEDFPTVPGAFDTSHNGLQDVFAARLSADGAELLASTFLGGSGNDYAWFAGLAAGGEVVLVGDTGSADFPATSGSYDTSYNGGDQDAWVARLALESGTIDVAPTVIRPPLSLCAYPNPAPSGARFAWTLMSPAEPIVATLFDAQGRVVWAKTAGASERELIWNGTDRAGRTVADGTYFLSVQTAAGRRAATRITVAR